MEQKNEKISVIIPIYNVEPYLRQCLDSVVNQTYRNLEIILVDDGSPDNCGAICDEYMQKDDRIITIHKKNGGLSAARNDALKLVTGTWISFVDSDDWCELDLCEKAIAQATKTNSDIVLYSVYKGLSKKVNTETRIHTFDMGFETEDKETLFQLQLSTLSNKYVPYSKAQPRALGDPWDKLYKASLIRNNGLSFAENVKAHEDVIFNIHAFQYAKKVSFIDLPLYHWRINPTSIGHKYTPDRVKINEEVYQEFFRIGRLYCLPDEYYQAVYERIVSNTQRLGAQFIFNRKNPMKFIDKLRLAREVLRSEPTYTAFEKADRKKLGKSGKFITISRHHNAILLYIATKVQILLGKA